MTLWLSNKPFNECMKSRSPCGTTNRRQYHCFQMTGRNNKYQNTSSKQNTHTLHWTDFAEQQQWWDYSPNVVVTLYVHRSHCYFNVKNSVGTLKAALQFFHLRLPRCCGLGCDWTDFFITWEILYSHRSRICQSTLSPTYGAPLKFVRKATFVWY